MNPLEHAVRHFDAIQQRHTPTAFVVGVVKKYGDDNGGALVSNLAHAAFVTLFPLLLLLVTILNLVLAHDPVARHVVLSSTLSKFPLIGTDLRHNVRALHAGSLFGFVVGILGLVWGSLGLAQAGIFAMEQVWNIPGPERPNYIKRLTRSLSFLLMLAAGLIITSGLAGVGTFGRGSLLLAIAGAGVTAVINVGGFLAAFRIFTPRAVSLKQLVPGAVLGGVGWTVMQSIGGYVVGHYLHTNSAVYGMFAIVIALVAWIYLGAELAVYSAEVNVVLYNRLWPRAIVQPPLTEADRRTMAAQAEQNRRRPEQHVHVSFAGQPMTQDQLLGEEDRGSAR